MGMSQTLEDKVCREMAGFCDHVIGDEEIQPISKRKNQEEEEEEEL